MSVKKVLLSIVDLPQVELAAVWIDVRIESAIMPTCWRVSWPGSWRLSWPMPTGLPWDAQPPRRRRHCHLFYRYFYSRAYRGPRRIYYRRRVTCSPLPRRDVRPLLWIRRDLRSPLRYAPPAASAWRYKLTWHL